MKKVIAIKSPTIFNQPKPQTQAAPTPEQAQQLAKTLLSQLDKLPEKEIAVLLEQITISSQAPMLAKLPPEKQQELVTQIRTGLTKLTPAQQKELVKQLLSQAINISEIKSKVVTTATEAKVIFSDNTEQSFDKPVSKTTAAKINMAFDIGYNLASLSLYGAIIGTNLVAALSTGTAIGLATLLPSFADPTGIALSATLISIATISMIKGIVKIVATIHHEKQIEKSFIQLGQDENLPSAKKEELLQIMQTLEAEQMKNTSILFFKGEKQEEIKTKIKELKNKKGNTAEEKATIKTQIKTLETEAKNRKKLAQNISKNLELVKEDLYALMKAPTKLSKKGLELFKKIFGEAYVTQRIMLCRAYNHSKVDLSKLNAFVAKLSNNQTAIKRVGQLVDKMFHRPKEITLQERNGLKEILGEKLVNSVVKN